jgi:hypothetical protein
LNSTDRRLQIALKGANRAALKNWLAGRPQIPDCIAVRNLFEEYMDFTEPLSDVDFDFALGNLESQIGKQRVPPPAEVKQDLIGEICDLQHLDERITNAVDHATIHVLRDYHLLSENNELTHWKK